MAGSEEHRRHAGRSAVISTSNRAGECALSNIVMDNQTLTGIQDNSTGLTIR